MGLTGFISEIEFKLIKINNNKIDQQKFFFTDLNDLIYTIKKSKKKYLVAWIDCFSLTKKRINSILYIGDHSKKIFNLNKFKFKKEINLNKFFLKFFEFFLILMLLKFLILLNSLLKKN